MLRRAAVPMLLVVATLAVYARVASFDFINFDDPEYVSGNAHVLDGLSLEGFVWAFTTTRQANWHPLTWLSLQLDAELFGPSPRAFHATNVLLHVVNVLLLFFLFARLTGSEWRSALVAGLFALHPLHVESVVWIAERKDVLSTAFGLVACHLWLRSLDQPLGVFRALAVVAYSGSLLAKPMLVSLPILLLLFDVWPLRRADAWRRLVVEKAPFIALAVASCVVTTFAQAGGGAMRSLAQYPLEARAANAAVSYVLYLAKAVWPVNLSVYYPYPSGGTAAWAAGAAILALLATTIACVWAWARSPYLVVGWFWYLVTLVPVIGLVQVGSQAMADRYAYIPLIGPFVMLAFGLPDLSRRVALVRLITIAAVVTVVTVLGIVAFVQAGFWRDDVTLFTRAIAVTSDNAVAETHLAQALFDRGDIDAAVVHSAEAVRIAPGKGDAESNLVRGLLAQGKTSEAAARAREAMLLRPNDSRTQVNAGLIARFEGRDDDAFSSFREAIRLDPDDADAHLNLGALLAAHGRREEAIAEFEAAARLRPRDARVRRALAHLLERR